MNKWQWCNGHSTDSKKCVRAPIADGITNGVQVICRHRTSQRNCFALVNIKGQWKYNKNRNVQLVQRYQNQCYQNLNFITQFFLPSVLKVTELRVYAPENWFDQMITQNALPVVGLKNKPHVESPSENNSVHTLEAKITGKTNYRSRT